MCQVTSWECGIYQNHTEINKDIESGQIKNEHHILKMLSELKVGDSLKFLRHEKSTALLLIW